MNQIQKNNFTEDEEDEKFSTSKSATLKKSNDSITFLAYKKNK